MHAISFPMPAAKIFSSISQTDKKLKPIQLYIPILAQMLLNSTTFKEVIEEMFYWLSDGATVTFGRNRTSVRASTVGRTIVCPIHCSYADDGLSIVHARYIIRGLYASTSHRLRYRLPHCGRRGRKRELCDTFLNFLKKKFEFLFYLNTQFP